MRLTITLLLIAAVCCPVLGDWIQRQDMLYIPHPGSALTAGIGTEPDGVTARACVWMLQGNSDNFGRYDIRDDQWAPRADITGDVG